MFVIYGRRKARINRFTDNRQYCRSCNSFDLDIKVYREYFHLFFIPLFPVGSRTVTMRCKNCGEPFLDDIAGAQYIGMARTPVWFFSGLILISLVVLLLVNENIKTQKEKARFVASPEVGDVYLVRMEDKESIHYYFLRLREIKGDTLIVYHNNLVYSRYISKLNEDDYFVKEDDLKFTKGELKEMLERDEITAVERNYGSYKGFNRFK